MSVIFEKYLSNSSDLEFSSSYFHEIEFIDKERQFKYLAETLSGTKLTIATLQNPPLSYAIPDSEGKLIGKGVAFELLDAMKSIYNFTYSVVTPNEDILGNNQTGIFGMLARNEANVAAAFLPIIAKYYKYLRYSSGLDVGEWVVLMKRPTESATGSGLLAPFNVSVWLLILTSLICVGPTIYFLIYLYKKLCKDEPNTSANLYACIWFVYGALLKQGSTISPITDSSRLCFATWWIFITILTAFYTANLTAFLTLSKFTLPVTKPSDIGAKRYSWVTRKGNAIEDAAHDVGGSLFGSLQGSTSFYVQDPNEAILQNYVKHKDYIYLGEKPIVEHMMFDDYLQKTKVGIAEADRCTFIITTWTVLQRRRAFAYSKSFQHYPLFDDILEHLVESGIIKHKLRDGLPNTQICPLNLGSKERQLRNTDLLLTYYIVAAGFIISGMMFGIELAIKFCARSKITRASSKDEHFHPPPYHTLFGAPFLMENAERKIINGRDYWVVKSSKGESSLVPIRTPSALLFQYTH